MSHTTNIQHGGRHCCFENTRVRPSTDWTRAYDIIVLGKKKLETFFKSLHFIPPKRHCCVNEQPKCIKKFSVFIWKLSGVNGFLVFGSLWMLIVALTLRVMRSLMNGFGMQIICTKEDQFILICKYHNDVIAGGILNC